MLTKLAYFGQGNITVAQLQQQQFSSHHKHGESLICPGGDWLLISISIRIMDCIINSGGSDCHPVVCGI